MLGKVYPLPHKKVEIELVGNIEIIGSSAEILLHSRSKIDLEKGGGEEVGNETKKRNVTLQLTRSAIMAALVAVATYVVQIPNPATRGYINFGDIMIFVSALTFGPIAGGFAGSVGSAISDVASGYGYFAPFTFVIKGAEGAIAGLISNRISVRRDVLAVIIAGSEMITGYFVAEFFPLQLGWAALTEVPGNTSQIVVGAIVGIPITLLLRKRLPEAWRK